MSGSGRVWGLSKQRGRKRTLLKSVMADPFPCLARRVRRCQPPHYMSTFCVCSSASALLRPLLCICSSASVLLRPLFCVRSYAPALRHPSASGEMPAHPAEGCAAVEASTAQVFLCAFCIMLTIAFRDLCRLAPGLTLCLLYSTDDRLPLALPT